MNISNKTFEQILSKYVVGFGLKLTVKKKELSFYKRIIDFAKLRTSLNRSLVWQAAIEIWKQEQNCKWL